MTGDPLMVTVLIVTYNHESYIAAALDSVLNRRLTFFLKLSSAKTHRPTAPGSIVRRYESTDSQLITAIYSDHNVRSNEVVARGLRAARGRYVCLLDGDDAWISNDKLQRQVDYLERHPEVSAVFHNAILVRDNIKTETRWTPSKQKPLLSDRDIWEGNPFATSAGMMRVDPIRNVPTWYDEFFPITDWPLYVLCSRAGRLAFVDEVVSIYRVHAQGEFSSLTQDFKFGAIEGFYRRMEFVLDPASKNAIRGGRTRYFFDWAVEFLSRNDLPSAIACFWRSVRGRGIGLSVSKRDALRLGARLASADARWS